MALQMLGALEGARAVGARVGGDTTATADAVGGLQLIVLVVVVIVPVLVLVIVVVIVPVVGLGWGQHRGVDVGGSLGEMR